MGRKTRAPAAALEMDEGFQSASRLWSRVRRRYPAAVREMGDIVAELGGLSLHDIEILQVAQMEKIEQRIERLKRKANASDAVTRMESLKLQCLKHLRTIRVLASPITTPNEGRHPEPEEIELRRNAKAKLLERMTVEAPKVDTGVELN